MLAKEKRKKSPVSGNGGREKIGGRGDPKPAHGFEGLINLNKYSFA
jgi:hypothetical protein